MIYKPFWAVSFLLLLALLPTVHATNYIIITEDAPTNRSALQEAHQAVEDQEREARTFWGWVQLISLLAIILVVGVALCFTPFWPLGLVVLGIWFLLLFWKIF